MTFKGRVDLSGDECPVAGDRPDRVLHRPTKKSFGVSVATDVFLGRPVFSSFCRKNGHLYFVGDEILLLVAVS